MQKKHLIGAGITAFSVILGLLWLIPLIWLIGTAFSVPSFHMTLFPTTAFTLDNIKYVWNAIPFGTYYINTLTLVVCTFAVQFFTSTLAPFITIRLAQLWRSALHTRIFSRTMPAEPLPFQMLTQLLFQNIPR